MRARRSYSPIQRPVRLGGALLLAWLLSGCASLDYYAHLAAGQLELLGARQPIDELLADPQLDPALAQRLQLALHVREFASRELALPDNDSYRHYADLQRPYALWNLFATEEFSLEPRRHCFPIAGCVAYRGFYSLGRARGAAALLRQQGLDTYIGGVEAYSTLGWFDDPLLNSMLARSDERLAALIFHELAHQRLYVADDTAFNESFASFVEQQGLRQWQAAQGRPNLDAGDARGRQAFIALIMASRERLRRLYARELPVEAMRAAKQAEFERLRQDYRQLRDRDWGGVGPYDAWIEAPLNNAKLLPFGLYDRWVPAFAELFAQAEGDWPDFYRRVAELARVPPEDRRRSLQQLQQSRLNEAARAD